MFDIIKNLKPAQRFYAFLIATFLTAGSAVLTSYLKTDDCSQLAKQNEEIIANSAKVMSVNNTLIVTNNNLMTTNNQQLMDLIEVKKLLADMAREQSHLQPQPIIRLDTSNSTILPKENIVILKKPVKIKINSALKVLEKYDEKNLKPIQRKK